MAIGEQAEDDLQLVFLIVSGVAPSAEWAVESFKVGGTEIVQDQRTVVEMALGESPFNARLPLKQPIHGLIEFLFADRVQLQAGAEGVGTEVRLERPGGGEFGAGFENAADDESGDEIPRAAGSRVEPGIQLKIAQRAEGGGDMAVREGAGDGEGLVQRADGLTFEDGAEGVDLGRLPIGEVSEGAVFDLVALAEGLAEEDGGRGIAVGDGGYVHVYSIDQSHLLSSST